MQDKLAWLGERKQLPIAILALVATCLHLAMQYGPWKWAQPFATWPLLMALTLGGIPLVMELLSKALRGEFGSDLLAGISIVTAAILGEYLAGTLVVLMLSGGEALESYAVRSASSVLEALSKRMPSMAHEKINSQVRDILLDQISVGTQLVIFPHEICPVDGTVVEGRGVMDESYLTGEPYRMSKTPGSQVLSGSVNGDSALTIRADRLATDSRYAQIMRVMQVSQQQKPQIRRLGDQLGAIYTPVAVAVGIAAWIASGSAIRFLSVMVVATPCPLLIAIPVAVIGSISLAAKRAIIIRDPAVLEKVGTCRTIIFDKTGTLTYGAPELVNQVVAAPQDASHLLRLVASLEQYSKHPLAVAVLAAAKEQNLLLQEATKMSELPGQGLRGQVGQESLLVTSRKHIAKQYPAMLPLLPSITSGLECVILVNDTYAATYQFRDAPRQDGRPFIGHLGPKHRIDRVMLLSGDRESEVRYLADLVGVREILAEKSPEEKLTTVQAETKLAQTIYVGDGINDAPALMAATVGVAFGQNSDVTSEAAGAVIMDTSLKKIDELLHIGSRMRQIALQSAVGGMAISLLAMLVAAAGYLPPVAGAVTQEVIDVVAVLNALRVALPPASLTDYEPD